METRANYIAVGFFTLAALVAAFVLVYWFGRYADNGQLTPVDIRIQGSVSGLGPGSAVQFNGINVGRVTSLSLDPNQPQIVIVHTELNAATPIRSDTRATIGIRGLSGGAFIQLEGGSADAPSLLQQTGIQSGEVPQIEGNPAALTDLIARINSIALRTENVMYTLESFAKSNEQSLTRTLSNVETFSKALAENSDGVSNFMQSAGNVAVSLERLSGQLDGSLEKVEKILAAVDPKMISSTIDNTQAFSKTLADQKEQIATLIEDASATAENLNKFTEKLTVTIENVDKVFNAVEPEKISSLITNIDKFAASAEEVLAALNQEKINQTIEDISASANSVRGALEGLGKDTVQLLIDDMANASKSVSGLLDAVEPEKVNSLITSIDKSAVRAEEVLAALDTEKINKTIDDISASAGNVRDILDGVDKNAVRVLIDDMASASKSVASLLEAVDAAQVNKAFDDISTVAEGAKTIIDDVNKVTSGIGARSEEIDQIITDASQLAARLNKSSKKIDQVMDQIDNLLGSGAGNGLVVDVKQTLAEFRRTARNLDSRIAEVTGSITSFTKRGLGDTQGLIRDARRSINRIDRVIRNIENNPSSLISGSGGSRVRETSAGRIRR